MDGGTSWERTLFVNNQTGASDLSMDMKNPSILYAAMWQHRRYPWIMESGGKDSGLYKSTDGGSTWEKMKKGLPKDFGKAGISVSRANNEIVFAVIEAEGTKGGVYKSTDAVIPEEMVGQAFDGGNFVKFVSKGDVTKGAIYDTWVDIWNTDLNRLYTADFEVYGEKAKNPSDAEVDIFVAVEE